MKLKLDDFVPSRHEADLKRFDFVVFKAELDISGPASLDIDNKSDEAEALNFEIPKDCIAGFLGKIQPAIWRFDSKRQVIVETNTGAVIAAQFGSGKQPDKCAVGPSAGLSPSEGGRSVPLWSWISIAFAGERLTKPPSTRQEIDRALKAYSRLTPISS